MAFAATQTSTEGSGMTTVMTADLSHDAQKILEVLSSTAALLTARGISAHLLDGEDPDMAEVLATRDDLNGLLASGHVVTTRRNGITVYGLKELHPDA